VWAPLVVVLLLWLVPLPDFGRLQYNDYYELLPQLADDQGHYSRNPLTYISLKSNEHTVAIPALIYVVNAKLTAGDNRGLSVVSLALLLLSFVLVYRWTPDEWRRDPVRAFVVVAVLAVFAMTPVAAHNVVKGFSGTIWLLANAVVLCAISSLRRLEGSSPTWKIVPVVVIGVIGALSYSTTLSLWPALIAGAFLLRLNRRQIAVIVIAAIVVIGTYSSFIRTPEHHPGADASHPFDLVRYLGTYFGNILAADQRTAMWAGWAGLAFFAAMVVWTIRSDAAFQRRAAPWLMAGFYGLGNGLGTAVTRGGFGLEQALASRYATLSAFLWLGAMAVAALKATDDSRSGARPRRELLMAAAVLSLATVSLVHGWHRLQNFVENAGRQPMVELALQYGIWDAEVLSFISPDPGGPIRAIPFLKTNRHVPFEKPAELFAGKHLPDGGVAPRRKAGLTGACDSLIPISEKIARIQGWVYCPGETVRRLLVIDGAGIVCGEARIGAIREDVALLHGEPARESGLIGWVLITDPAAQMRLHVQFEGDEFFYPVGPVLRPEG
jgi:hypothetical protein